MYSKGFLFLLKFGNVAIICQGLSGILNKKSEQMFAKSWQWGIYKLENYVIIVLRKRERRSVREEWKIA